MALEKASFSKIHPIPSVLGVRILCHSIFPIFAPHVISSSARRFSPGPASNAIRLRRPAEQRGFCRECHAADAAECGDLHPHRLSRD